MKRTALKFSASGVRGVVGSGMTPHLTLQLAAAFGVYQGRGQICVGRDGRLSGEMLSDAVCAGLLAAGCRVIDLGIVPTPTIQFMVRELGASGGIAVTASHNPAEWNALKFIGGDGTFLDPGETDELFNVFCQHNTEYVSEQEMRELEHCTDGFARHAARIYQAIDFNTITRRKLRVAIDCCNGAGALHSVNFLRKMNCTVFAINDEITGTFNRIPEPAPENLGELAELVKKEKCDIGFAQDPDGDRLTLIDDTGRILSPQMTVALVFEHVLEAYPGAAAVNLQTTRIVEQIVDDCGGELFFAPTGEINVVRKMRECGAGLGGEGNCGGIIWKRILPGRDSYSAMALLLELLALSGGKLSDISDTYEPVSMCSDNLPANAREAKFLIDFFKRKYAKLTPLTDDGVRLPLPDGWLLIRYSNTEELLRLTVESSSIDKCRSVLSAYRQEAEDVLRLFHDTER